MWHRDHLGGISAVSRGRISALHSARLHGSVHIRPAEYDARVVDQVARREVVAPVDDEIVISDNVERVRRRETHWMGDDAHVRIDLAYAALSRLDLWRVEGGGRVDDLTLQVRLVHNVVIDDTEGADTCEQRTPSCACARRHASSALRTPRLRKRGAPAAARYMRAGEPSPPLPMHSTLLAFSRACPSMPTSARIRWRE